MLFKTQIRGIPCQCRVTHFSPEREMVVTGPGFGDAEPPEPMEFEYEILDRKGYRAKWLEKMIDSDIDNRLFEEFHVMSLAAAYDYI